MKKKTKKEFQDENGFSDECMERIELAKSMFGGKITEIYDKPLDYQHIKISMKRA